MCDFDEQNLLELELVVVGNTMSPFAEPIFKWDICIILNIIALNLLQFIESMDVFNAEINVWDIG